MTLKKLARAFWHAKRSLTHAAAFFFQLDEKTLRDLDERGRIDCTNLYRGSERLRELLKERLNDDKAEEWIVKLASRDDPEEMLKELPDDA